MSLVPYDNNNKLVKARRFIDPAIVSGIYLLAFLFIGSGHRVPIDPYRNHNIVNRTGTGNAPGPGTGGIGGIIGTGGTGTGGAGTGGIGGISGSIGTGGRAGTTGTGGAAGSTGIGGTGGIAGTTGTGGTGTGGTGTGGAAGSSGSCGNGTVDPGEACDGSLLVNSTCVTLGFTGGSLSCSSSCQFNVSSCTGGTITPTVTASRTSCTAPCGVMFDATSTSGLSGSNYWRANWIWDFNDPTSTHKGTIGFVAAHIFDNPGTYNVKSRVQDLAGNAGTATTTITVSAMSGTTYYVASSGNDSNNGTSMSTPFLTMVHAISIGNSTNNSILFRRGDTFSGDAVHDFNYFTTGPFLMGAYTDPGSPSVNDPIITSTFGSAHGQFSLIGSDIRLQHLHLFTATSLAQWVSMTSNANDLVEYVEMEGQGTSGDISIQVNSVSSVFIADNYLHDFHAYGVYAGSSDSVGVFGNRLINFDGGATPLHGVRLNAASTGTGTSNSNYYLADNTFNAGISSNAFTSFTIHGDVQHVVVANNTMDHDCGAGPTNTSVVEKPNAVLFEGNVMQKLASNVTYVALAADASQMEIRNNILVNADSAIVVGNNYPLMPANWPDQVFVENNSAYQNPPAGQPTNYAVFFGVHQFTTGAATFLNNIFWQGMTINTSRMIGIDGAGTETIDYNEIYSPNATLTNPTVGTHGVIGDPKYVSIPAHSSDPITASGFALQSGSPALDVGTNTHVYQSFGENPGRPQNTTWDMGAFERKNP